MILASSGLPTTITFLLMLPFLWLLARPIARPARRGRYVCGWCTDGEHHSCAGDPCRCECREVAT